MKMNSSLLSRVGMLSTSAILLCGIQAAYGFESDSIASAPEAGNFFGGWNNNRSDALSRTRDALKNLRADGEINSFFEGRDGNALALEAVVTGDLVETTKVRHYYNGVEVIGSMAFHHRGRAGSTVRNAIRHFNLDTTPSLSQEEAVSIARGTAGDRALLSQPALKILPMDEGAARLVYWVELNASGSDEARDVIIDAKSGEVLADLSKHLDLALNIAHGGITLDNNPENLQRDHIFPRATLEKAGTPSEKTNHYANFHFLRGKDNLNKSDTAPHEWFKKPGEQPAYSDDDLKERLLTWDLLQPGQFPAMLEERTKAIHNRALTLFGMKAADFDALFAAA